MKEEIFRVNRIYKQLENTIVLNNFSLSVFKGEIVGVFGKSGTGKSCLLNVISGNMIPDKGELYLEDEKLNTRGKQSFGKKGIFVIRDKVNLFSEFSIAENIFVLNAYSNIKGIPAAGQLRWMMKEMETVFEADFLGKSVAQLTYPERICVEMLKAWQGGAKLIILDDTINLQCTVKEPKFLYILNRMKKIGIGFIVFSRQESALSDICDVIYFLDKGMNYKTLYYEQITRANIDKIVSTPMISAINSEVKVRSEKRKCVLVFRSAHLGTESICLYEGYISGIVDTGDVLKNELLQLMRKRAPKKAMWISGKRYMIKNLNQAMKRKVGIIDLNQSQNDIFGNLSISNNITLLLNKRLKGFFSINSKKEKIILQEFYQYYHLDYADVVHKNIVSDQIRILFFRWKLFRPKAIFVMYPLSKFDTNTRIIIENGIKELAIGGTAVLVLSTEKDNLRNLCNEIIEY